jgi:oxygen-dependent protoporphyrinogen oxidase
MIAIIGGGITGLAAAWQVTQTRGAGHCMVFEAGERAGGKIRTQRIGELEVEDGPDAFLAAKPEAEALCRALGLGDRLVGTDPRGRKAFVRRGHRLFPLPEGLTGLVPTRASALVGSGLISVPGRLRAALEPLVPRRLDDADESVAGFVTRRFGREVWERIAEPLLAGISAGDGTALSLVATLPRLQEAERRGSLLVQGWRRRHLNGQQTGFLSLRGGLRVLVDTLTDRLAPGTLRTGATVTHVDRLDGQWQIRLADGRVERADDVLLATPPNVAGTLLTRHDSRLGQLLHAIPSSSSAVVTQAWARRALTRPRSASGWLVPRGEGSPVIAVSLSSNKFPHRAPDDVLLVRVFLGRHEAVRSATDDDLLEAARAEVRPVLGIVEAPSTERVMRWPDALPQYTIGHRARVVEIERRCAMLPGVRLAGCGYRGLGISDCIRDGTQMATELLQHQP